MSFALILVMLVGIFCACPLTAFAAQQRTDTGRLTLAKNVWDGTEGVAFTAQSSNPSGSDWVGLYPAGANPSVDPVIARVTLTGADENALAFSDMTAGEAYEEYVVNGVLRSGNYDLHLLWNDNGGGYGSLCLPASFTVQPSSFEQEMLNKGFPPSYLPYLTRLHNDHPYWEFEAVDITGLSPNGKYTFEYVIAQEDVAARNLVVVSTWAPQPWTSLGGANYSPYYDTENTTLYDSGWRMASNEALRYFMDPRNFLNDVDIFMFESMTFNENVHTVERVNEALAGSFMGNYALCDNGISYAQHIYNVGKALNVSPVSLAGRLKQEQGAGASPLVNGTLGTKLYDYYTTKPDTDGGSPVWGTYKKTDVFDTAELLSYDGLYNFFNIGASGNGRFAIYLNGAKEAQKGGWTTKAAAIAGGAQKFADMYVGNYQDTLYFQKFNVDPRSSKNFWGQYMQNIAAPLTEGRSVRKAYATSGILERAFVFKIPVYDGLPETACPDPAEGTAYYSPSASTGANFGSDSYAVTINNAGGNGTLTLDGATLSAVQSGTTLNFVATPDIGYRVSSFTVNGKAQAILNDGDGAVYTLQMPPQDLEVAITFAVDNTTPPAPNAPTPTIRLATSLKVLTVAGYEYKLNDGEWQASPTFSGLQPNTTYRVYQRIAATATHAASESSPAVQMTTRLRGPAAPDAPTPTIRMATSLKVLTVPGYQYRLEGGEWQNSAKFTGLKPGTTYRVYQRIAMTDTHNPSDASEPLYITTRLRGPAAPDAPIATIRMATSLKVLTVPGYQYRLEGGEWQNSATFKNLKPGTTYKVYQRVAQTDTHNPSDASVALTITTRLRGPAAPAAPVATIRTTNSIKVKTIAGYQYRIEGGEWQDSATFTGLKSGTTYKIYQRVAQTDTHNPSDASEALVVTTK